MPPAVSIAALNGDRRYPADLVDVLSGAIRNAATMSICDPVASRIHRLSANRRAAGVPDRHLNARPGLTIQESNMHKLTEIDHGRAAQRRVGGFRPALMALAALLGAGIAGGASAQIDWGRSAEREDRRTCERFGAGGGREHTRCMLQQQQRRDNAPLYAAEQQRNNAEAARNNVETVRRIRCNREAKRARERGERPQSCR